MEVEVQRNAYGPHETTTHRVRVAEDASATVIGEIRDRIRHAPHDVADILDLAEQRVRHEAHEMGERTKEAGHAAMLALSPQSSPQQKREKNSDRAPREGGGAGSEDDGWMSDQSGGTPSGTTGKARSKSPKIKIPKTKIATSRPVGSGSRKRTSIRRGLLGQRPQVIQRSQSEDLDVRRSAVPEAEAEAEESTSGSGAHTPDEGRGRSSGQRPPPGPRHGSGVHTPRHMRIDSIRSATQSREMSPARSVRFADEHPDRSGHATPKIVSSTSPSSPAETEAEGEQEDDSPRSQVRFSLPTGHEERQP